MVDPFPSSGPLSTAVSSSLRGGGDYESWSKEALIDKVRKLECHVFQLRNVIAKRSDSKQCFADLEAEQSHKRKRGDGDNDESCANGQRKKKPRPFDFSQHDKRHVALKFLYLGWDYQGLACQEDTNETIEAHLFKALTVTRLIEERSKSNYHRCGRTDKGVSAFSQVISIDLRSKLGADGEETIDYCNMLNRTLPKEIRILAWAPVRADFSARFDCNQRTYKYFFPRGNLDLEKMQKAANYLEGEHNFKNLCKPDGDKPTVRRVIRTEIVSPSENGGELSSRDMCKLIIVGNAFLWHQIRCIVAVLFLVGKGFEEPEVVEQLLDVDKCPRKPQYGMAVDYPLVLYDVDYPEAEGIRWIWPTLAVKSVLSDLQSCWTEHAIKSAMITEMMKDVEKKMSENSDSIPVEHGNSLLLGTKRKTYLKLLDRPVCGGSEKERLD